MKHLFFFIVLLSWAAAQSNITLEPQSVVTYEASDPNTTWTGQAPVLGLELTLNPETLGQSNFTLVIHAGSFNSGNFIRDANARRIVFESHLYPEIIFVSKQISAVGNTLTEGNNPVTIRGDLTMHGVNKELSILTTIQRNGNHLTAEGSFEVSLNDFSMKAPEFFGLVVDDKVVIRFILSFQIP